MEDEPSDASNAGGLGERVGRVENMLEVLMQKVDSVHDKLRSGSQPPSKLSPSLGIDVITPCATPSHLETAPVLSLFDNAIVCTLWPIFYLC